MNIDILIDNYLLQLEIERNALFIYEFIIMYLYALRVYAIFIVYSVA